MADDPAMRAAAEKSGVNVFGVRWKTPTWPYIEPLKDASADLLRVRNALCSQRRRCGERNIDWDEEKTHIVADNASIISEAHAMAEALKKENTGLEVSWRELAALPTPDGINISVQPDEPGTQNTKGEKDDA